MNNTGSTNGGVKTETCLTEVFSAKDFKINRKEKNLRKNNGFLHTRRICEYVHLRNNLLLYRYFI
jgi:hypothetical protein